MTHPVPFNATLGVKFQLECRDADGNVLKVIDCEGSVPLDPTPITETDPQEAPNARVE